MADQVMKTSDELSVLVPEIWSQKFYDVLLAELPFKSTIDNSWEGEIQELGDTVKISSIPEFSDAIVLEEGTRSDADAVTVLQQSLVINKRVVKDFIVTNKALLQSIPFVDKMRDLAVYSVMKKIEAIIIAATIPSASAPDHQISYDTGSTLALADIVEAKELLDTQDVPLANRYSVMAPAQFNDIYNISGFTSSDYLLAPSGAPLQTGTVPTMLLGFVPMMTTLVSTTSYWYHSSYQTIAVQRGMNVNQYDLGVDGKRAQRINVDVLMGVKQLDDTRVVTIS